MRNRSRCPIQFCGIPFILFGFFAFANLETRAFAGTVEVKQSQFGDKWPFSVEAGRITCTTIRVDTLTLQILTFTVGDKVYALNGAARGRATTSGWLDIDSIWKDNPKKPGTKIDISPIMKKGLEACDK